MLSGRLLRIPLLRVFGRAVAQPAAPLLPFSARQAGRARSPLGSNVTGRGSRPYPLTSRRAYSTSPPPSPTAEAPKTLSGRLKHLIKTHGWYALGVYAGISLIDFTLAFTAIYFLGADQVSAVTNRLKDTLTDTVGWPAPSQSNGAHDIDEGTVSAGNNGIYTIAILAYGIHKTLLLPVRIGLTAGITPRFVAFLTKRGWVGQGGVRRATQHVRERVRSASDGANARS